MFSALKYSPEENEFPWGEDFIELGRIRKTNDSPSSSMKVHSVIETNDNNYIFIMGNSFEEYVNYYEIARINQDGERTDQQSIQIEGNRRHHLVPMIANAVDDGFWIYTSASTHYPTRPVRELNWFDSEAQLGLDEPIETGLPTTIFPHSPAFWIDPNGGHRFIFDQTNDFSKIFFNEDGQAISPVNGEVVEGVRFKRTLNDAISKKLGNSIYCLMRSDEDDKVVLVSFDLEGDHEWTIDLEVRNTYAFNEDSDIIYDYVDNSLLIGVLGVSFQRNTGTFTPHLFKVDADNGELIWSWTQPNIIAERPDVLTRNVTLSGGFIYHSFFVYGHEYKVYKLSREGRTVWRRPVSIDFNEIIIPCGMVHASSGGVYIGVYHDLGDSVSVWLNEINPEGEIIDSLNFFGGYTSSDERPLRYQPKFNLHRSLENIWLVSRNDWLTRDETLGVVQGLQEDGTRLVWLEEGYRPQPRNGVFPRISEGVTDGAGGFWLLYYYPSISEHNGVPYTIWLDPQPGYPRNPLQLIDNTNHASNEGQWVTDDGDLVAILNLPPENLRLVTNSWSLRLQRIRHPEELSSTDNASVPEKFALKAAYPNPFNSMTLISYSVPVASHISLKLYNLAGREVRTLTVGKQQAGRHSVTLKADELASGLYFARMEAMDKVFTQKLLLIK